MCISGLLLGWWDNTLNQGIVFLSRAKKNRTTVKISFHSKQDGGNGDGGGYNGAGRAGNIELH